MSESHYGPGSGDGGGAGNAAMPQHTTEAREDRKRRKELEEARQSGKAAPEIDVESGKMINPHNPEYITKRPWYLGESGPSLNHHAVQKKDRVLSMHEADAVARERKLRQPKNAALRPGMWVEALYHGKTPWLQAKVIRVNLDGSADLDFDDGSSAGSASNRLSAMARKQTAKAQKKVPREHIKTSMVFGSMMDIEEEGKLTFDAKRDRWHGYNPNAHKITIERYNAMDDERRKRRQAAKDEKYRRREAEKAAKAARAEERKRKARVADEVKKRTAGRGTAKSTKDGGDNTSELDDSDEIDDDDDGGRGGGGNGRKSAGAGGGSSDSDSDSDSDYDSDGGEDDDFDDEEADEREFIQRDSDARDFQKRIARQGGVGGAQMKTTVRNLRIREDTAKYLRNLDPNSAFYDPKTRSMRDNPLPSENPEELPFAGDNFQRISGDAVELAKTTVFAWEASARSDGDVLVDSIATPSQVEFSRRQFEAKKAKLEHDRVQGVLDKYGTGGAEALDAGHEQRRLALAASEGYVEYARDGRVVRGAAKAVAKSKYAEDVMINNHTAIWGSWFDRRSFKWGFGDDHSTTKNSYSTGTAGRAANDAAAAGITAVEAGGVGSDAAPPERPMLEAKTAEGRAEAAALREQASGGTGVSASRSALYGEPSADLQLDPEKLREAMAKERKFQKDKVRHEAEADEKKRKYNSFASSEVTAEEMEAYRMMKSNNMNDPMAKFATGSGMSDAILDYDGGREAEDEDDGDHADDGSTSSESDGKGDDSLPSSKKQKKEKKRKKQKKEKNKKRGKN